MFRQVLADNHASTSDRVEALKFLVHFVADLHQPLHAIGEAKGGNDIQVADFGSNVCGSRLCNLHFIWDVELIRHTGRSEAEYDAYLENLIAARNLQSKAHGTPEEWANQSFRLAHQVWLNDGGSVDETYFRKNIIIVDEQLALAGLRLAALLNQTLGRWPNSPVAKTGAHPAANRCLSAK
jgi:hypothetical protein